eukprot:2724969-Pyramimonas_sp.AAC.1
MKPSPEENHSFPIGFPWVFSGTSGASVVATDGLSSSFEGAVVTTRTDSEPKGQADLESRLDG